MAFHLMVLGLMLAYTGANYQSEDFGFQQFIDQRSQSNNFMPENHEESLPVSVFNNFNEIGIITNNLERTSSDNASLATLLNLSWPLKDVEWYLLAINRNASNISIAMGRDGGDIEETSLAQEMSEEDLADVLSKLLRNNGANITLPTFPPPTPDDTSAIIAFIQKYNLLPILFFIINNINTQATQIQALAAGEAKLAKQDALELNIRAAHITFINGSATLKHQVSFRRTDPISTAMARAGIIDDGATLFFATQFTLVPTSLVGLPLLGPIINCESKHSGLLRPTLEPCTDLNNPYRTLDGSCNNLFNNLWGAAFTCYRRYLPPKYTDGISLMRFAVSGKPLPRPRLISIMINVKPNDLSADYSILHMTFGQFIDHDLTSTPLSKASFAGYDISTSPIRCCTVPKKLIHPQCAAMRMPSRDPFYKCHGQNCMEFVRSAPCGDCHMGPREQTNQMSSYLDGSAIYGVKAETTNDLRTFSMGQMKVQVLSQKETLLPPQTNITDGCNLPDRMANGEYCFKAGDGRVNEQPLLTFFHTLFVREHNRIARFLHARNPLWDDERLFQKARRIVVAELQQVTYNEYLPTLIGPTLMSSTHLYPLKDSHQTTDYDPLMNAAIANVFAAAAYRFGHSSISDNLLSFTKDCQVIPTEFSSLFFNPFDFYTKTGIYDRVRGGISLPERQVDPYFSTEVAGKLFRGTFPFGLDLLSINIQRGRDHGLPAYNEWRAFCGLPLATSFTDLLAQMTPDRVAALQSVYIHVNDIDVYVGGISETPLPGAILGPTFSCLIHDQFLRLKRGDRYWFEYKNGPGAFTPRQMKQLHRVTLARIMCNNLPKLTLVQRWPLKNLGPNNPKLRCRCGHIKRYYLRPW